MKISELQKQAWETAEEKGFHAKFASEYGVIVALALIGTEVSEAIESVRSPDDPETDPLGEELADIAIRVADLAEEAEIDLQEEVSMKMGKNRERDYRHGGKNF